MKILLDRLRKLGGEEHKSIRSRLRSIDRAEKTFEKHLQSHWGWNSSRNRPFVFQSVRRMIKGQGSTRAEPTGSSSDTCWSWQRHCRSRSLEHSSGCPEASVSCVNLADVCRLSPRSVCLKTYLVVGARALYGVALVRHGARSWEKLVSNQLKADSGSVALAVEELSLLLTDIWGGAT